MPELRVNDGSRAQCLETLRSDTLPAPLRQTKQPILDQTCDLASTPDGQRAPSSGNRHEQTIDVDLDDLDLDGARDALDDGARVALVEVLEDDLEDDALFGMVSMVAQGAHPPVRYDDRLETSRRGGEGNNVCLTHLLRCTYK